MNIETANRLVELRKQHNFSQEDLAAALGISRQAVSKWERAEASPDTDNLISLARLYQVSLDELLGNSMPPAPVPPDGQERAAQNPLARTGFPMWFVLLMGGVALLALVILGAFFFRAREILPILLIVGFVVCTFAVKQWHRALTGAYPVLCVLLYLVCGFFFGSWHPTWLIFLTIPLFYTMGRS